MSDYENPYQSPETQVVPEKISSSAGSLSETMLRYLKEASPWLRFVGIVGIVFSGIMVVFGIIFALVSFFGSDSFLDSSMSGLVSLAYIPSAVLLFIPSLFTLNFGSKIRSYLVNNLEEDLELAFKNNKSLWKFNGIVYIVSIALIPVGIIVGVIIAFSYGF